MADRVFLHIGAPKTGTTFLQTVMWKNRPVLKRAGLLYPGRQRFDHFLATRHVRRLEQDPGRSADAWNRLLEAVRGWPDDAVITHEFFCAADEDQAAWAIQQLAPAEVHLVLTVRDYVRQFPAVWQEALKMGAGQSLDDFVRDAVGPRSRKGPWGWLTQDIPAIVERWGKGLDPASIHIVTVPPPGAPRHLLWQRWCQVLGLDPDTVDMDVAVENESLGAEQAALLHRVQPHLSGPLLEGNVAHRWFRQYLGHEVLVPQGGSRFGLHPDHATSMADLSRQAAQALANRGYSISGDLGDLVPQLGGTEVALLEDVTEAQMLDVAVRAIEQMVRDVRSVTMERDELRRLAKNETPEAAGAPKKRPKRPSRRR